MDDETVVAGKDESRLTTEGTLTVTRRVVNDGLDATTVELIETEEQAPQKRGTMLQVADFGQMVWTKVVAIFDAARNHAQIAWGWLVDTLLA